MQKEGGCTPPEGPSATHLYPVVPGPQGTLLALDVSNYVEQLSPHTCSLQEFH